MPHHQLGHHSAREYGFSLMEVLVSIVVLSFGLLGMVGMQAAALQSNREARLQSLAAGFAKELAEMMRGNSGISMSQSATDNPYLIPEAQSGALTSGKRVSTAMNCYLFTGARGNCETDNSPSATVMPNGPTKVATWEIADWRDRLEATLPGSKVVVCFDATPYESNGVPRWRCTNPSGNDNVAIKIGWTRRSTDRSSTGDAAFERATVPSMVVTLAAGRGNAP